MRVVDRRSVLSQLVIDCVVSVRHTVVMRLVRPEVIARHRGVRPVFLLALALALAILVLVAPRERRADRVVSDGPAAVDWFAANKAHCNPVEVTTFLASHDPGLGVDGATQRAACLAIAGKIGAARKVLFALPVRERTAAADYVFLVAHPVADAGDDESAGPIMELVVELEPDQYMALYHAGMAEAIMGDDDQARRHLTRFLEIYRASDGWTRNAWNALGSLDRPRAQRVVKRGGEGSIVY